MVRGILSYLFGFRRRRITRERLARMASHHEAAAREQRFAPESFSFGTPKGEMSANYVPTWAKPEGKKK
jgi:hypothetical protein